MDGIPLPEAALVDSIRNACGPALDSDITLGIRELESARLIDGNQDDITNVITWSLTDRGQHKAKQLS
jgi:hypothetical protein